MLIIGAVIVFLLLAGGWGLIYGLLPAAEDAGNPINNHANIPVDPVEASLSSSRPAPENPESVSDSPVAFSDLSDSFKNSIEMEFVLIPAGEFLMGSPEEEAGRGKDEGPVHPVQIEKPFYLGKYEVTGEQWCEVMGTEPLSPGESELPAAEVSWEDVQIFIEKLNKLEGTAKYRLPSEAEWEYACRAGSSSRYSFGDEESKLAEHAWFESTPYSGSRHPVGLKEPNAWGLYDMHGNAWEWVQDTWHNDYSEAPEDGRAWEGGVFSYRVTRGGSVTGSAADCRAANRIWFTPNARSPDLGFRLLREA
ncbi:formylglycine-generating enzyme family protein [Methanosarcina sp. KYL-1]|nr:formylglycine-generating enzyme family protein [Methanosarcina sp. KYL-1]